MRFLLDTHALLWWWTDDPALPASARERIADPANEIVVSAASAWEVATKVRLGKLPGLESATARFNELVVADGFIELPITQLHAVRAGGYDAARRDPFDRMLAAQAEIERMPILSRDPALSAFPCEIVW
ncbi:type II toxin-antitoxin system VapC family toxin [Sphingosinicella sp.]|uniref:type II toxin-antitoxin system VapC family toxin n=1 Tax=Sphingosinicella sp. TaxID=1917971 RepID=UPI002617D34A|nr:type II toxin-antitoxin system VapC family toxin [Sphingosinicella sp.]